MFFHNFKYSLKNVLRQKDFLFWILAFPIILGTFFYVAFNSMYEKESMFNKIPVAIVENTENTAFKEVIKELSSGETPMFDPRFTDSETALDMLKTNDISGIIYVDSELSLTVSKDGIKQTIIKSFLDQYQIRESIIMETVNNNPQNLQYVIDTMSQEINCNESLSLSNGNMDTYIQYFYNLIAMAAFFGSVSGLYIAINNQGNLSAIAARKCISPTNKPQNLQYVIDTMSQEINCNESLSLSNGNMDTYIQYFYNLIAMAAFFGSVSGLYIAINNQGNLSAIAARKCISPTNKLTSITASLLASFVAQVICVSIGITYILFILKVDMGNKIPMVYLSGAVGSLTGVTMGFFIGSFGRLNQNVKMAISMSVTMLSCFLSGLMVGNMKTVIETYAPVVNRINPAALISDLFYCLNIYNDYRRYTEKFVTLLILSVVFTIGGFLLTRRK
ncbi:MAG: ABC transporter permease, partial [Oscillospiraceae bacterium]|nr:ABC transporter permease [Oscillospiraceae bacterium]